MKLFGKLFKNVPSDNFKISMKDFKATETNYYVGSELYEEFKHEDLPLWIVVNVDTLQIKYMRYKRITIPLD